MSNSQAPVLLRKDGAVAEIRFNRPEVLNALNPACARALHDAVRDVAADDAIRAVIVSGEGRAFMAGGDISSFEVGPGKAAPFFRELIGAFHGALEGLATLPKPIIASLNGAVAGAGFSVALATDLAIAADNAKFTLAYSRLGTSPDGSSSWTLPRVVGLRKALEIALLSDVFDAAEALRLGVVNKVVPAADLERETRALAERLAAGPTLAYGEIKKLMRNSFAHSLHDQLGAEGDAFVRSSVTADFAEGVAAFLGKRPARFEGA